MHITLDTANLTSEDLQILALLVGGEAPPPEVAKPKKAAAATPKSKPAPEPEPEPEDPTMKDAVKLTTDRVSKGQAKAVKAVLKSLEVERVSALEGNPEGIATYVTTLRDDDEVNALMDEGK